jgi:hypothetical protein
MGDGLLGAFLTLHALPSSATQERGRPSSHPRFEWLPVFNGAADKRGPAAFAAPSLAVRHPWPPELPSQSLPAQRAKGRSNDVNHRY